MSAAPRETEWHRRKRRDREREVHVAEHGPGCELCGNIPKVGLNEDHDHRTGTHRGWLCGRCNKYLHYWMTPVWLRAAADYIEAHS